MDEFPCFVHHNQNKKLLVVFVHGLKGDGSSTWLNKITDVYWPLLVANDDQLERPSVYVYQFDTKISKSSLTIDQLGSQFSTYLEANKCVEYESIVFVAHSMGGLITRNLLLKNGKIAAKTKLLYMLGVPTQGGSHARVLAPFSPNKQIADLIGKSDGEDYLRQQEDLWRTSPSTSTLPHYCVYEVQKAFGLIRVVNMRSATALSNRDTIPIDGNHFEIVKPDSQQHPSHVGLIAAFEADINQELDSRPLLTIDLLDTRGISTHVCFSFSNLRKDTVVDRIKLNITNTTGPVRDAGYMAAEQITINRSQNIDPLDIVIGESIDIPVRVKAEIENDCFYVDYFPTLTVSDSLMKISATVCVLDITGKLIDSLQIVYPQSETCINLNLCSLVNAVWVEVDRSDGANL